MLRALLQKPNPMPRIQRGMQLSQADAIHMLRVKALAQAIVHTLKAAVQKLSVNNRMLRVLIHRLSR